MRDNAGGTSNPKRRSSESQVRLREHLAYVIAIPGSKARVLDGSGVCVEEVVISKAIAQRCSFEVPARRDLVVFDGSHPLAGVDVELVPEYLDSLGVPSVVMSVRHSDGSTRYQIVARKIPGAANAQLRTELRSLGFSTNRFVRVPLDVRGRGLRVSTGSPQDRRQPLALLSPTPRPLSLEIYRGVFNQDRSSKRSPQSFAWSVANAGGTRADLRNLFEPETSRAGRYYRRLSPQARIRWLRALWRDARFQVQAKPADRQWTAVQVAARRTLQAVQETVWSTPELWRTERGSHARRILIRMIALGCDLGSADIGMSVREAGMLAGCHFQTGWRALGYLQDNEFLELLRRGAGEDASEWRIRLPEARIATLPPQDRHLRPTFCAKRPECPDDCACNALWWRRGLGTRKRDAYELLSDQPRPPELLAPHLAVHRKQVIRLLGDLARHDLATPGPTGWTRGPADPHAVANALGIAHLAMQAKDDHEKGRARYRATRVSAPGRSSEGSPR